jgi:hypothetical protein
MDRQQILAILLVLALLGTAILSGIAGLLGL